MEKELLVLSEELIRNGLNIDLVVVNTIDTAYFPSADINLVDLQTRQIRFVLIPLVKYLRDTKPEVMFSAETPMNAMAIIARMITGFPKRLIVSERNHLSSVTKNAIRLGDRIRPWLVQNLYPKADLIITVSKGVAKDLIESYKIDIDKIQPIYNMFDINKIVSASQSTPQCSWLEKDASPIIINVGRLSSQKDHATLIKAFAIAKAKRKCRLLILGEGAERPTLINLIQDLNLDDDVFMPGFVSNPYAYIARAKLFVLSSAWEGLPGALIEALACGIPVVSTDCPSGPAEILENGKYGLLTPVRDAQALADAILDTLKHPKPSTMLHQRAMDFSIEKIFPQYLEILQTASVRTSKLL